MSLPADVLHAQPHPIWDSRRLWSLADMINFILHNFVVAMDLLRSELNQARGEMMLRPHETVSATSHDRITSTLKVVIEHCVDNLRLPEASSTAIEIYNVVGSHHAQPYTWRQLHALLERLESQISIQIQAEFFCHYTRENARLVLEAGKEWQNIITAFPSTETEIVAGIDCFAIGHCTACVFYMMRTAEFGLRMIARERGIKKIGRNKPLEWGTWQDVFQAIEGELRTIRQAPQGPKKEAALRFYDSASSDLRALQTHYRDPTMHFRDSYDRGEAYSAMFRVKSLMSTLATKLSETNPRKIRWGL